jgi:beta-xylosidase
VVDQKLFFDDDDRVYLCVSRLMPFRPSPADPPPVAVILGCEVDLATGASLSRPVQLARSTTTSCAEGPHILKRDGWYWLLVAEGGTAEHHQVRMSRSKFPMGPYECPEDDGINPLLFNWLHPTVRNTGHADFVQDTKGHWWAYFLGTRPQSDGSAPLGRECMMTPMEWREGEWPTINQGKKVELSFESAVLPPQRFEPLWKDSFEQGES